MAIDVFAETVVAFAEATKRLPRLRAGRKMNISTLYRWSAEGHRAADGSRARLETIKLGGTTCTSLEALQRFFDRLTSEAAFATPPQITSRKRLEHLQQVEEELRKAGI